MSFPLGLPRRSLAAPTIGEKKGWGKTTMWVKKDDNRFDAAVWKGPINLTTVTVRISMLLGLGALWLGLAAWIFFSS
ncbi:MAG: hypothetical protein AAF543_04505 [Pseudomonadota bacterium]